MRPVALSEHRVIRIVVLCTLYVAQGIPFGFFTVTLTASMAADGLDATSIGGVFAVGTLPWVFKWVWGPFVDRFGSPRFGRRRPWILAAQMGMATTLLGMWFIPDPTSHLLVLGGFIFFHNVFNSLQDVCVDALAIDLLPAEDRGKASGLMYGAKYLGTAIGGGGLTLLVHFAGGGLSTAFAGMIVLILLISLLPLLTVERPGQWMTPWSRLPAPLVDGRCSACGYSVVETKSPDRCIECGRELVPLERVDDHEPKTPGSVGQTLRELVRAFSGRAAILTGVVAVFATTASGLLAPIGAVLFVKGFGWSEAEYGTVTGGAAVFAGLIGSVGGGFLADLVGPRRVLAAASIMLAGLLAVFGLGLDWFAELDRTVLWTYLVIEAGLLGCVNAAFFAICYGICRPAIAATQFTAYMALMNLGTIAAQASSGPAEIRLGLTGVWLLAAAIQGLAGGLVPLTRPRKPGVAPTGP
ncbi:MAG: MFS transporter [Phycisphaera sp.]|nr:MFS transporter [Phycisphaera sp.]